MRGCVVLAGLWAGLALFAQDKPKGPDQAAIDKAIENGVAYLKDWVKRDADRGARPGRPGMPAIARGQRMYYELILWTFLHAGVPEKDEAFQKVLTKCLEEPIWETYNVALMAMSLQKLDPIKYQKELVRCGQFFVDTQAANGQWSYGRGYKPGPDPAVGTATSFSKKKKGDTESRPTIKLKKGAPQAGDRRGGGGDNSCSQYASLGIRACHMAGIEFPKETIESALAYWETSQNDDGSYNYGSTGQKGYGSMTCGALGAIAILQSISGKSSGEKNIEKASEWIGKHFSLKKNPEHESNSTINGVKVDPWFYYYLYSLERAGDLISTEKFGPHYWYAEGAEELLKLQKPDGSWKEPSAEANQCATCFAILFLKRATTPVIRTGDDRAPK